MLATIVFTDVGYDGIYPTVGFALNVINKYFTEYYPRAVSLAEGLRLFDFQERLVYTTHPWLLRLYLNCTTVTMASNVSLQVGWLLASLLMGRTAMTGEETGVLGENHRRPPQTSQTADLAQRFISAMANRY